MPGRTKSATKPKGITALVRTAYHEAGHAVLSAALNDTPHIVSIKRTNQSLGRTLQRMVARPEVLMQVHLAGLAAEHRLTGRRSRSLKTELGFSILCLTTPGMSDTAEEMGLIGRDEYMVVEEILRMGCVPETDAIKAEVERFYLATQESLAAVWPSVSTLAEALLKHGELDRNGILRTLVGNIYDPVFAVQRAHGLRSK